MVIPAAGQEGQMSFEVGFDDQFRLQHVATGRFLHSHPDIASPVTGQQEVTAFGSEYETDENDTWQLQAFPDHEYDEEDYVCVFFPLFVCFCVYTRDSVCVRVMRLGKRSKKKKELNF